jgi:multiple sugar transport system substrate-binding protein
MTFAGLSARAASLFAVCALTLGACAAPPPRAQDMQNASAPAAPIKLRLGVSLTAEELKDYEAAVKALDEARPEWEIALEQVPQDGNLEKLTANAAAGTLPDVQYVFTNQARRFIAQGAFLYLTPLVAKYNFDLDDFYPNLLTPLQFEKDGVQGLYGIPTNAAPEIVFYNKAMFDAAKLSYPTDAWTLDDMRVAARKLTLDKSGRNAEDPAFDKSQVAQWGWYGALPAGLYSRSFITPLEADWCANPDCSQMDFTSAPVLKAIQFWADMSVNEGTALADTFRGSQTGAGGDPFIAGQAAMGMNGWFAIGQLNSQGTINYDVVQPFKGPGGTRGSGVSVSGYAISAASANPDEAFKLLMALSEPAFLSRVWAKPGHGIPARRSVAADAVDASHAPANQAAAIAALEYGQPFAPYTSGGVEAYLTTIDLFIAAFKGERALEPTLKEIATMANDILQKAGP